MSNTVQEYLATATEKAAEELIAAYQRLPEEKRTWQPAQTSRSAQNLFIECALLSGYTADVIRTRNFPADQLQTYSTDQTKCEAINTEDLQTILTKNVAKVAAEIRVVPDDAMSTEIVMPWQTQTLGEVIAYPYWNMSYHLGQINYIASLLNCLK